MEKKDSSNARSAGTAENILLRTEQAAEMLNVKRSTLEMWRCQGIGPVYVKMPGAKGAVRYHRHDLEQFLAQNRHVPSVSAMKKGKKLYSRAYSPVSSHFCSSINTGKIRPGRTGQPRTYIPRDSSEKDGASRERRIIETWCQGKKKIIVPPRRANRQPKSYILCIIEDPTRQT